jgi:hypothetical protein
MGSTISNFCFPSKAVPKVDNKITPEETNKQSVQSIRPSPHSITSTDIIKRKSNENIDSNNIIVNKENNNNLPIEDHKIDSNTENYVVSSFSEFSEEFKKTFIDKNYKVITSIKHIKPKSYSVDINNECNLFWLEICRKYLSLSNNVRILDIAFKQLNSFQVDTY